MPEEKSDDIKSTKDVISEKLKDEKLNYGPGQFYEKAAQQFTVDLPKKVNILKTKLTKSIYNCLPDEGISNANEIDGLVDKIYDTASGTVSETLGLKATNEDGKEELEETIKSYMGNLDKKTLKKDFEEQLKETGYIDSDSDMIRNNILRYPVSTFSKKKQQRLLGKIEEKLESPEEFEMLKSRINSLAKILNKTITDKDIYPPNKAIDKWMQLERIHRTLQKL